MVNRSRAGRAPHNPPTTLTRHTTAPTRAPRPDIPSAPSTATFPGVCVAVPFEGQVVGPAFNVAVHGDTGGVAVAAFYEDGILFAEATAAPFRARRVTEPGTDGRHEIAIVLYDADGASCLLPPVRVEVRRDLYGRNTRVSDSGSAFAFPDGRVTVAVGQNDAYPWPGLCDLYRKGDLAATERYVASLAASGVNVTRVMLEYAQFPRDLLEKPLGTYNPEVVAFWDAFLPLCEKYGVTVLLTPWDTFWMNKPWARSPFNAANGGPCATVRDFITSPEARRWQKERFRFLIDRWGDSPAIFAIDLLNEFDIWWEATPEERADWIDEMAAFVQDYELERWGHRHMITASASAANPTGTIADVAYRHPRFEFANTHQYYPNANRPKDIIAPAKEVNGGIRYSLGQIEDGRPYTDTESGPIGLSSPWLTRRTEFDDRYFHHMAWAHFASGGAGGGMRWPYRQPHVLSDGMHAIQAAIGRTAEDIDWRAFQPSNADARLKVNRKSVLVMGCADERQAIVWVSGDTRRSAFQPGDGHIVTLKGLKAGRYLARCRDTTTGAVLAARLIVAEAGKTLAVPLPPLESDIAITIGPLPDDYKPGATGESIEDVAIVVTVPIPESARH